MNIKAGPSASAIDFDHWIPPERRPLPNGLFVTEDELQESIDAARANFHPQPEEVSRLDPWDYFMHDVKEASAIRLGRYIPTRIIHDERAIEETKNISRIMPSAHISKSDYLFDLVTGRGDFHGDRGIFFRSEERKISPSLTDKTRATESSDMSQTASTSAASATKAKINFSHQSNGPGVKKNEDQEGDEHRRACIYWKAENDVSWDIRNGLSHNPTNKNRLIRGTESDYQFKKPVPAWMRRLYKTINGLAEKDVNGHLIIPCWTTDQEWIAALKRANRLIEDQYKVKSFFAISDSRDDQLVSNTNIGKTDSGYVRHSDQQVSEQLDKDLSEAIDLDDNLTVEEFTMLRQVYGI